MAASVSITDRAYAENEKINTVTVTADNAYPTGGYALTPGAFGLGKIDFVAVTGAWFVSAAAQTWYLPHWDRANNKLMAINSNGGTELANATDLTGYTVELVVFGS